jgi:hypothetical protein
VFGYRAGFLQGSEWKIALTVGLSVILLTFWCLLNIDPSALDMPASYLQRTAPVLPDVRDASQPQDVM